MKAITSAFSLAALLAALLVMPGCGGGDEAAPPADAGMPSATDPVVEMETDVADPGISGAVDESAPGDPAAP